MDIAIMIEGQDGLTWPRWQRLAHAAEDLGFAGLYRSDHYTNAGPPDRASLELWVSLTWLAGHTRRIEFGPLVSPVSIRHPTHTARMAAAVDDLSGGRLILGLGAGWNAYEHQKFGWELLEVDDRMQRFQEGLQVITRLLRSDNPVNFEGQYYHLREAILLPRPQRPGGPPVLVGGNGQRRTLPLVARYANEWNGVYLTAEEFSRHSARLDALLEEAGRSPAEVRRTLMVTCFLGRDPKELRQKLAAFGQGELEQVRREGGVVGTPGEIVDQLGRLSEAGVQRVMLQWLDQEDIAGLETLSNQVLPQVQTAS